MGAVGILDKLMVGEDKTELLADTISLAIVLSKVFKEETFNLLVLFVFSAVLKGSVVAPTLSIRRRGDLIV